MIDRHGEVCLAYAKVHTCDFGSEAALTPGDGFRVCSLDTAAGPVHVGAMICYDREFPESARVLMLKGAELILTPNACTLDGNRLSQFRARAFENMVALAMTNYAAPQNNGHSIAFDGIAYGEGDWPGREMLVVEAGEAEGVYLATFDLAALRAYRQRESWGNAYRKPKQYGLLADEGVRSPFMRPDSRR
jgi:N-carbamoylputrescine amidase